MINTYKIDKIEITSNKSDRVRKKFIDLSFIPSTKFIIENNYFHSIPITKRDDNNIKPYVTIPNNTLFEPFKQQQRVRKFPRFC